MLTPDELETIRKLAEGALLNIPGSPKAVIARHDTLARNMLALFDHLSEREREIERLGRIESAAKALDKLELQYDNGTFGVSLLQITEATDALRALAPSGWTDVADGFGSRATEANDAE